MKGIILAGGYGTRLYPVTKSINKHLLPVYDKPMIYYPLSVLMLAGIKDIIIISNENDIPRFKELLNNGSQLGISIEYNIQEKPNGIAEAFIICCDFIGKDNVALILGDNIFYGQGFSPILEKASLLKEGAVIFANYVQDPCRFGIVQFDKNENAVSIEEKPDSPKSNYAVTGLYFYDNNVINIARNLSPSYRGELEITDINKIYLKNNKLKAVKLGRGFAWLDAGTHEALLEASQFIETIEKRQGLKIACLEEIAYRKKYITKENLLKLSNQYIKTDYGRYLKEIAEDNI